MHIIYLKIALKKNHGGFIKKYLKHPTKLNTTQIYLNQMKLKIIQTLFIFIYIYTNVKYRISFFFFFR